uniref:Uncharacterized protein n=1 Tax=Anguilla anguilla TaxID=7936 RepID=A0A0E9VMS1_ANGAN
MEVREPTTHYHRKKHHLCIPKNLQRLLCAPTTPGRAIS